MLYSVMQQEYDAQVEYFFIGETRIILQGTNAHPEMFLGYWMPGLQIRS